MKIIIKDIGAMYSFMQGQLSILVAGWVQVIVYGWCHKLIIGNVDMTTAIYKTPAVSEINEFRKSLITWAQNQATGQRTQAAIGKTAKHHDMHTHKAESYDFVVAYLSGMEIKE